MSNCYLETRPNFFKTKNDKIVDVLRDIKWEEFLLTALSVDELLDKLNDVLKDIITKYVPSKRHEQNKYPTWFSKELITVIKNKYKCHLKLEKYNYPLDHIAFGVLRKKCKDLMTSRCNEYKTKLEKAIINDPKFFWSYIKGKRKGRSFYPAEMH